MFLLPADGRQCGIFPKAQNGKYRFAEEPPPRQVNAVPKYGKHRASGPAAVTILGQDRDLGPHGTKVSRDAYDRLIAAFLAADQPSGSDRRGHNQFDG